MYTYYYLLLYREEVVEHGMTMDACLAELRKYLTPNAVIIGQNIAKDIEWLGLDQGTDYDMLIDLTALFRVWNVQRNSWTMFSQDHIAKVYLNVQDRPNHDALDDALLSISLFNCYRNIQYNTEYLQHMQMLCMNTPITPSYAARNGAIEDCCLGHRKKCTCGDAFHLIIYLLDLCVNMIVSIL